MASTAKHSKKPASRRSRRTKSHRLPTADIPGADFSPSAAKEALASILRAPTKPRSRRTSSFPEWMKGDPDYKASSSAKWADVPVPAAGVEVLDGKYRLDKLLGQGGMGTVWSAQNVSTGKNVAVKILHPALAESHEERERFLREGVLDNLVDASVPRAMGPGAVAAYDSGMTEDGAPYLVLDHLQGESLEHARVHAGGKLPSKTVERALDEALLTLESAHRMGIVHRDLKPENMFLTRDGSTRVLDFGLAQVPGDPPMPSSFVGTSGFASPEQSIGLVATPATDTWGMGAAAYRLLTGETPLPYENAVEAAGDYLGSLPKSVAKKVLSGKAAPDFATYPGCPVPPVRSRAKGVPRELAKVVDKALACDPAERYPDATAMREDLERAVERELMKDFIPRTGPGSTMRSPGNTARARSTRGTARINEVVKNGSRLPDWAF